MSDFNSLLLSLLLCGTKILRNSEFTLSMAWNGGATNLVSVEISVVESGGDIYMV